MRNLLCFLIVAIFILMSVGVSNAKMVGYWSFDDANNLGKDSSGNNNNGEVKNNLTWSKDGKFGGCAHFNMADANKAYIVVPHSDSLNLIQAVSIEAWVNPDTVSSWMSFSSKGDGPINWSGFINASAKLIMFIGNDMLGDSGKADSISINKWQHVVVSNDANGRLKFYIDGVLVVNEAPHGPIVPTQQQLIIGGTGPNGVYNRDAFNGYLDELKIYDHQLTDQEVITSMAGPGTSAVGPIGKLATNWGALKMGL